MESIKKHKELFLEHLNSHPFTKAPESLYEPMDYILQLGGKRLRPIAVLLGHECYDGEIKNALDAALAIEVFHNFSLVHDDIMDEAPTRRGKESVHTKYGINTGILSGDVMLIKSYQLLSRYGSTLSESLLDVFSTTAIEVCEGQQMDMDFEEREDVTITEYIDMIKYKTSVLFGAAFKMGALIAGASEEEALKLYHFGVNIGIAFQIQDDILDTFGDARVGKQEAGDIIQNKKTYLYLKALQQASEEDRKTLRTWYSKKPSDPTEKIAAVKAIFSDTYVVTYADELKSEYKNLAYSHLDSCKPKNASMMAVLRQLSEYFLQRNL